MYLNYVSLGARCYLPYVPHTQESKKKKQSNYLRTILRVAFKVEKALRTFYTLESERRQGGALLMGQLGRKLYIHSHAVHRAPVDVLEAGHVDVGQAVALVGITRGSGGGHTGRH